MRRGRHCTVGLTMSRRLAREVLGDHIAPRAGMKFAASGLARVLCHHLQATFDEAGRMAVTERAAAAKAAKDMALALLQATHQGAADPDRFAHGFHRAALGLIDRECGDPNLTPERIAYVLSCSRASLYPRFRQAGRKCFGRHLAGTPGARPRDAERTGRDRVADLRDRRAFGLSRDGELHAHVQAPLRHDAERRPGSPSRLKVRQAMRRHCRCRRIEAFDLDQAGLAMQP